MNALITGNSAGLGLALTRCLLADGATVWGMSRRGCPLFDMDNNEDQALRDRQQDLAHLTQIEDSLDRLLGDCLRLDLVILNAGVLGKIQDFASTDVHDLELIMRVNAWANKVILDWLIARQLPVTQIVAISSGAAVNMHHGWGPYALSKAALNQLMALYAEEMPDSHLMAYAPGLVDTDMQAYISEQVEAEDYPSVARLQAARGTDAMPDADQAARTLLNHLEAFKQQPSGAFIDIRRFKP
jgi:NAD(P)-dependent dehydrogenase (short-subunit alcohol dehydrogenase family)